MIYNIDVKRCRLSLYHQHTVLHKGVYLIASKRVQNVILFKGFRMKPKWKDDLPPGTLALITPKGSMNIESFKFWMEHFEKYKLGGKCLLMLKLQTDINLRCFAYLLALSLSCQTADG